MKHTTAFGSVLSDLIRDVYGSRKVFAQVASFSEAEVSQLISGKRTELTPRTLKDRLFPAFLKLHHQQRLWEAYVTTYLPSPALAQAPKPSDSDDDIERYLASTYWLTQGGSAYAVFVTTRTLWNELRQQGRNGLGLHAAHAFATASLSLDRQPEGLIVAREMRALAIAEKEPALVARSLWIEATAVSPTVGNDIVARAYRDFSSYVATWHPRGMERPERNELAHMSLRDLVVMLTRRVDSGRIGKAPLEAALRAFTPALEDFGDQQIYAVGKVVETEALLALGRLTEAEESLEIARTIAAPNHPRQPWKIQSVEARLLLAEGQTSKAVELATKALDEADRQGYIHGHNALTNLLSSVAA